MIIINFKNYKLGKEVLEFSKRIKKYKKDVIICIPALNIKEVKEKTRMKVYAQHIDFSGMGRGTGYIIPESLNDLGIKGSLLNHSEHPLPLDYIKSSVERCRILGINIIVCVKSIKEAKKMIEFKPWAIAYEDPKLIASGKSVVDYDSEVIEEFVELFKGKSIIPICGAGINKVEDIKKAYSLGCKGVLISSAIMKSKDDKLLKQLKHI